MQQCPPHVLRRLHVVIVFLCLLTAQRRNLIRNNCVQVAFQFNSYYNHIMSSTEDTSSPQLKAGHPPAVKAGGMRITQHKTPHTKDAKEGHNEDLTGLSGPSPVPTNPVSIVGAPNKGNEAYTPEAAQVAHSPKPPAYINVKPSPHIQQPRK